MLSLGIVNATPFNSANLLLAEFNCRKTLTVSNSMGKGNIGILYMFNCFSLYFRMTGYIISEYPLTTVPTIRDVFAR